MPQDSTARLPDGAQREQVANRSASDRRPPARERLALTERSLSEVPTGTSVAVVVPRLRSVMLAALAGPEPGRGAVNPLRWGRPPRDDHPKTLPPVAVETSTGDREPVSLTVESGPNYAYPLRAVPVDGRVPPDARVRRIAEQSPPVEATLHQLVEVGRARLPAVSKTYRTLAGDDGEGIPPSESRTLCHLDDAGDAYRVVRRAFDPAPQPMQYVVVTATETDAPPHFGLALPDIGVAAVRPFRRALRDSPHAVTDSSIPPAARDVAATHEFVLTTGGVYEVTLESRG